MAISEIYLQNTIATAITKAYLGGALVYTRSGASYDTATQALLDQATTDGYTAPTGATLTALDAFIVALKAAGIWTLCDVIYLPATNGDSDFACYNLKNPATFKLTKVNSPTFTALQGFTGNGTTSYLNTNWNPNTDGVNFVLNSASGGGYIRNNLATNGYLLGVQTTSSNNSVLFRPRSGTNGISASLNSNSQNFGTNSDASGLMYINRAGSSGFNVYRNTSVISSYTSTSTSIPSRNLSLLARETSFGANSFSAFQLSFAFTGADLSAKASDLHTAINTYMTTLGTNV